LPTTIGSRPIGRLRAATASNSPSTLATSTISVATRAGSSTSIATNTGCDADARPWPSGTLTL
jgi:hypothetical protein